MNMESMNGFTRKSESVEGEKKLSELTLAESNILQGKLAVLYFNKIEQEEGGQGREIHNLNKEDWTDEEKNLFREAFFAWSDEKRTDRPSLSFRDYISKRHPEETIDMNDPSKVHKLFEEIMINRGANGIEHAVQQDLI